MAKEKQVVKMAKVIEITEQIARDAHCGYPSPRMMASDLYDKGYRERSEVAREIFEEIEKIIFSDEIDDDLEYDVYYGASVAIGRIYEKVDELKKKYI